MHALQREASHDARAGEKKKGHMQEMRLEESAAESEGEKGREGLKLRSISHEFGTLSYDKACQAMGRFVGVFSEFDYHEPVGPFFAELTA